MYQISNFMDNDDINMLANAGPFTVIEYERDLSVMPLLPQPPISAAK